MKFITFIALILFSLNSFAYSSLQILEFSIAEIVYATALPTATTDLTVNVTTTQAQKKQALEIQNEIQNYLNSKEIGPLLSNKINFIKTIDESFSVNECIDILSIATTSILEK